jgi:hypothetical protein
MNDLVLFIVLMSCAAVSGMVLQASGFVPWVIGKFPWSGK